jgi:hypothetical protein
MRFFRHGGIYRSDMVFKPINPGRVRRLPLGDRAPVKDATEGTRLKPIVRDEFRPADSSIGLLASIARLRFTGNPSISAGQTEGKNLSLNGNCVFSPVSHLRGAPHLSVLICVHLSLLFSRLV